MLSKSAAVNIPDSTTKLLLTLSLSNGVLKKIDLLINSLLALPSHITSNAVVAPAPGPTKPLIIGSHGAKLRYSSSNGKVISVDSDTGDLTIESIPDEGGVVTIKVVEDGFESQYATYDVIILTP